MKVGSPLPHKKARIEIIPLIDIMFFLLACFMLVSLSMIQMRGMKINMPTAATGTPEQKSDFVTVTVDVIGDIYLEKDKVTVDKLLDELKKMVAAKPDTRIYIRADKDSTHGSVVTVLDKVKLAGITKVAFEIKGQPQGSAAGTPATPGSAPAPAAPPKGP
ncbi:MAG TPA: biopolymer transporter ExbD [Chthoniobacterales bacterium]